MVPPSLPHSLCLLSESHTSPLTTPYSDHPSGEEIRPTLNTKSCLRPFVETVCQKKQNKFLFTFLTFLVSTVYPMCFCPVSVTNQVPDIKRSDQNFLGEISLPNLVCSPTLSVFPTSPLTTSMVHPLLLSGQQPVVSPVFPP